MQQLHPRLQAHIRTCMSAQPDPTRAPYEHIVAILIQQVAPGKPEDYLHQTIALIARRTETQILRLHMQFTEAYDAYRDLCARLRSPPPPGSPVAITRPPAPSLGPCFFCNAPDHGHRVCPSYLRASQDDPTLASKWPACRAPEFCPVSCPRRQYFIRSTRFPYLEVDSPRSRAPGSTGATATLRRFGTAPPWRGRRRAPAPADTDPWPTTQPPANPPAAQRAVFCAAPPAPSAPATPTVICNHTRLGTPPRAPKSPTHTRAWATIDGVRCEVIIDTGADLSLISADVLRPHRSYHPWAPAHGSVTRVNKHTLQVLGRVALKVRLGPLKTTAPFFVVPGVAFAALLGVDFLHEHEIAVSLARHALIFEGHGGQIFQLLGHHPRLASLCALAQDVALRPGSTAWVRTTLAAPAAAPASPLVHLVAASTLPGVGLAIPEELTSGLIAIRTTSDRPLHLSAGWPLAKAVRLPPAAIHTVRLVATDSAPPPTDGAADTPSYEKVPGGFLPTLPSPNSCLLPTELQQLHDLLHEFRDRFNDGSEPLPATSLLKVRLDTGDAQPISTPPRRLSPAMRQAVREAVAELDAQGITEPSTGC
ncbi:hypothetical protein Emag_006916 [Eimeria magna]